MSLSGPTGATAIGIRIATASANDGDEQSPRAARGSRQTLASTAP